MEKMELYKDVNLDYRCIVCNHQLFKLKGTINLEIKCPKCSTIHKITSNDIHISSKIIKFGKQSFVEQYKTLLKTNKLFKRQSL